MAKANKATTATTSEKAGADSAVARSAIAEAWNTGGIRSHREELEADCSGRKRRKPGVDERTWNLGPILRKVYKEVSDSGAFTNKMGLFGITASDQQNIDASVAVAHSVLSNQRASTEAAVERGGDVACLSWMADGTPQFASISSRAADDKLKQEGIGDTDIPLGKGGTRNVLAQHGPLER